MKKNLTKILSLALCLVLMGAMCISAAALEATGSGTKNDPYLISTAAELDALSAAVAAGEDFSGEFIRLESNITANTGFTAIGSPEAPFKGSFDGNGKTLSGFSMNCDYAGVFGYTEGAVITGLTVAGSFTAESYAGGIAAYAVDTTIEGCTSSARIYSDDFAGGIAGYIESGRISDCATLTSAFITGYNEYSGGIAGFSGAGIRYCENASYVRGAQTTGGIAGASTGSVISCTNKSAVTATKSNVGGIVGANEGVIKYCKNTGAMRITTAGVGNAGGIAGVSVGAEIAECHSGGMVSATGSYVGGISGNITGTTITNCVVSADVSTSSAYAGGIFGYAVESTVSKCVVTSRASAQNSTAAGIGALSQATVSDCYYSSEKNTKAVLSGTTSNTTGLSASELVSTASLSALDFTNTWTVNTLHASAYPLLNAIPFHNVSSTTVTPATCTVDGKEAGTCSTCLEQIEVIIPATGHTYNVVSSKLPTCTANGYRDLLCTSCSDTASEELPATGHTDADGDSICEVCNTNVNGETQSGKTFLEKIGDFFRSILNWIKNLFVR